jgi:hypothetical protein
MKAARLALLLLAVFAVACARRCGGLGGLPPEGPDVVVWDAQGRDHRVVTRGAYKAWYDPWGRLEKIEWDSNGDGRPDHIAHYEGGRIARLIEIDENYEGTIDRWEYYDEAGVLIKIGSARRGTGAPDYWIYPGPNGLPRRIEIDDDRDGKVERAEIFEDGQLVAVELDTDRDGRVDRWQRWVKGKLRGEDLDTDGDGKPDRRIAYDEHGAIIGVQTIPQ